MPDYASKIEHIFHLMGFYVKQMPLGLERMTSLFPLLAKQCHFHCSRLTGGTLRNYSLLLSYVSCLSCKGTVAGKKQVRVRTTQVSSQRSYKLDCKTQQHADRCSMHKKEDFISWYCISIYEHNCSRNHLLQRQSQTHKAFPCQSCSLRPLLVSRKKGDRQVSVETRSKLKAINSLKFHDRGHTVLIIGEMK